MPKFDKKNIFWVRISIVDQIWLKRQNKVDLAGKEAEWCQRRRKTGKISRRTNPVSKERQKAQGKKMCAPKLPQYIEYELINGIKTWLDKVFLFTGAQQYEGRVITRACLMRFSSFSVFLKCLWPFLSPDLSFVQVMKKSLVYSQKYTPGKQVLHQRNLLSAQMLIYKTFKAQNSSGKDEVGKRDASARSLISVSSYCLTFISASSLTLSVLHQSSHDFSFISSDKSIISRSRSICFTSTGSPASCINYLTLSVSYLPKVLYQWASICFIPAQKVWYSQKASASNSISSDCKKASYEKGWMSFKLLCLHLILSLKLMKQYHPFE